MEIKHTPGPLTVNDAPEITMPPRENRFKIESEVCGMPGVMVVVGACGYKPNATLFSAAPDLLESLREMVGLFAQDHRDADEWVQCQRAQKAIDKATE